MASWQPILTGELAARARSTVLDIARALADGQGPPLGSVDATLFWAYTAGAFDDVWIAAAYDDAISKLADDAMRPAENLTLYYGSAGIGFAIAHVSEPGSVDANLEAIDALIGGSLARATMNRFDLIMGLAGVAVYLLERGDAPSARTALDHVMRQLIEQGERTPDGFAWFTPPSNLPSHLREVYPDGHYNCGVAHGVPGVLAIFARAAQLSGAPAEWRTIALDIYRWVLAQRRGDAGGRFPNWFARDDVRPRIAARTAWCYGDPGVALTLYAAATRLGLPTDDALVLARESARRPFERTQVVDAGLCHGAIGLAHIYNRLFQASGDDELRVAACTWYERALDLRNPTDGLAGYRAWIDAPGGEFGWRTVTSMLQGISGIGLALVAALTDSAPAWDRTLQCEP